MQRKLLFLLAAIIIMASAIQFTKTYASYWLPFYSVVIDAINTNFDQVNTRINLHKKEHVIKLFINNSQAFIAGSKTVPANLQVSAHTLLGHITQHLIFYSMTLLTGLYYYRVNRVNFVLCGLLGLVLVELGDIPFVLLGSVEGLILEYFNPDALKYNPLVIWTDILLNGGRIGFSIITALLVIVISMKEPYNKKEHCYKKDTYKKQD